MSGVGDIDVETQQLPAITANHLGPAVPQEDNLVSMHRSAPEDLAVPAEQLTQKG
jgi:hypothetical protein